MKTSSTRGFRQSPNQGPGLRINTRASIASNFPLRLPKARISSISRVPQHAIQLYRIFLAIAVFALHLSRQLKSKLLIYWHIGHLSRALQITPHALRVRHSQHLLHQFPPHTLPLRLGQDGHDIAEIVALLTGPQLFLRFRLPRFPNPIPLCTQPAATIPCVHSDLIQPQPPVGEVQRPGFGLRRRLGRHPHCAAEDFGGIGRVAGDVKEAVSYTPAAAEGEGDAVAHEVDLEDDFSIVIYGIQLATPRSSRGMRLQRLGFFALDSTGKSRASIGLSAPWVGWKISRIPSNGRDRPNYCTDHPRKPAE